MIDFGKKRPRLMLPSEMALGDMAEGASMHETLHQMPTANTSSTTGNVAMGALGGLNKGIQDVMGNIQPVSQQPVILDEPTRMYARGGILDPNAINIVGDAGPEAIIGNQVIPADQTRQLLQDKGSQEQRLGQPVPEQPVIDRPAPYGLDQTENGDDTGAITSGAASLPDARQLLSSQPTAPTADDQIAKLRQQALAVMQTKPSKWKDFGFGLLQGVNNSLNHRNDNETYSDIVKNRKIAPIASQIQVLEGQRQDQRQTAQDALNAENVRADNARLAEIAENNRRAKADAQVGAAAKTLAGMQVFNNKNPAHIAIAKRAGNTDEQIAQMGSWDFKNPVKSVVNGETYQFDRNTGEWNPTNLPKEPMVGLELTIPGQKPRVFNVPESKAAGIASSLQAAGMQIEAKANLQKAGFENQKQMLDLQDQYKKGFADYQHQLDEIKAEKDSARRVQLQTLADQNKATLIGLRGQIHQLEQQEVP